MIAIAHTAGAGHIEAAEDVQQRRLAAARRPQQHHEFTGVQIQINAAQGMDLDFAGAVDLGQTPGTEDGFGFAHGLQSLIPRRAEVRERASRQGAIGSHRYRFGTAQ